MAAFAPQRIGDLDRSEVLWLEQGAEPQPSRPRPQRDVAKPPVISPRRRTATSPLGHLSHHRRKVHTRLPKPARVQQGHRAHLPKLQHKSCRPHTSPAQPKGLHSTAVGVGQAGTTQYRHPPQVIDGGSDSSPALHSEADGDGDDHLNSYLLTNYLAMDEFNPCEREEILGGVFDSWTERCRDSNAFANLMSSYCESTYLLNRVTLERDFPNAMSCAMTCEILDKLATHPSKHQRVLQVIREGFLAGIYKDHDAGTQTYLEKTTWFSEVQRLEGEIEALKREVENLRITLRAEQNLSDDEATQDKICDLFSKLELESQKSLLQFLYEQNEEVPVEIEEGSDENQSGSLSSHQLHQQCN